jgi:hypothetical protein
MNENDTLITSEDISAKAEEKNSIFNFVHRHFNSFPKRDFSFLKLVGDLANYSGNSFSTSYCPKNDFMLNSLYSIGGGVRRGLGCLIMFGMEVVAQIENDI